MLVRERVFPSKKNKNPVETSRIEQFFNAEKKTPKKKWKMMRKEKRIKCVAVVRRKTRRRRRRRRRKGKGINC